MEHAFKIVDEMAFSPIVFMKFHVINRGMERKEST